MKLTQSLIALMTTVGLLAVSPSLRAQTNTSTNSMSPPGRHSGVVPMDVQLHRLSEQLKLTDEQRPKVKTVLEERSKQLQALWGDSSLSQEERRSKMRSIEEETNQKMKGILTPEQFAKYQSLFQPRRGRGPYRSNAGSGTNGGGGAQ